MSKKRRPIGIHEIEALRCKAQEYVGKGEYRRSLKLCKVLEADGPSAFNRWIAAEAFRGLGRHDLARSVLGPGTRHPPDSKEGSLRGSLHVKLAAAGGSAGSGKFRPEKRTESTDSALRKSLPRSWPPELPVEVVGMIFSYLDLRTLLRCLRVCKGWRSALLTNPGAWGIMDFSPYRRRLKTASFVRLARMHHLHIRHLNISGCGLLCPRGCEYLSQLPLRLTSLSISGVVSMREGDFCKIVESSRETLKYLDVSNTSLSSECLGNALTSCKNLAHVDLSDCTGANLGACIVRAYYAGRGTLSALSALYARSCKITSSDIEALCKYCPHIQVLILDHAHVTGTFSLELFSALGDLRVLSLRRLCARLPPAPAEGSRLVGFPRSTKELNLAYVKLDSATIRNLIHCLPELEKIDLSQCTTITDHAFYDLRPDLSLRSIILTNCSRLTDRGISRLVMSSCKLEHLDISGTAVSGSIIDTISRCSCLRTLDLSRVRDICSTSILKIIEKRGCTLEALRIDNCANINTLAVHRLRSALRGASISAYMS